MAPLHNASRLSSNATQQDYLGAARAQQQANRQRARLKAAFKQHDHERTGMIAQRQLVACLQLAGIEASVSASSRCEIAHRISGRASAGRDWMMLP